MQNPLDYLGRIKRRRAIYREVFGGPAGQAVLQDLCKLGHVADPVTVANDPIQSAYRDGQRALALHCLRMLEMTDREAVNLAKQQDPLTDD